MSMNNENNTETKRENELGALWRKESQAGKVYYSGVITLEGKTTNIVLFENDKKPPGSKGPDWRILKSNMPNKAPAPAKQAAKPAAKPQTSAPAPKYPPTGYRPAPGPRPQTPRPLPVEPEENEAQQEQTL